MSDRANTPLAIVVNTSHGRPRVELRGDAPLPPPPDAAPDRDSSTGRFVPGNAAHKRRAIKSRLRGVATLNPDRVEPWLREHVRDGAAYGLELAARFTDPALSRLVGDCADAHAIYRALLAAAASGDRDSLVEARGWLKEHRATLRELAALAKLASGDKPESPAELRARILTTKGNDR